MTECARFRGMARLWPPRPAEGAVLVLLAARFDPGSSTLFSLPRQVVTLILDSAFSCREDSERVFVDAVVAERGCPLVSCWPPWTLSLSPAEA